MKLLVFTQKINKTDPILGFFHTWVTELSHHFDEISVICLEKGEYDLPSNVSVYSLGKEVKHSTVQYLYNLYYFLYKLRGSYDRVFVHMNQEYVLLGGLLWKLTSTPVFFWRNHPYGNILTRIAVLLSSRVFCTSKESFTARFKKTKIMPAGVDTSLFLPVSGVVRKKYSVCMIGRVAPVKGLEMGLEAIKILIDKGVQVSSTVVGSALPKDADYYDGLVEYVQKNNLGLYVSFVPAIPPQKIPEIYSGHEICLNMTTSGSFDKTIIEAAACGTIPLVSNTSLRDFLPGECVVERNAESVAFAIEKVLQAHTRIDLQKKLEQFVSSQSLSALVPKLTSEIKMYV